MIKRYTFDQLDNFVRGYRLKNDQRDWTKPTYGKFQTSICDALDEIHTLSLYYPNHPEDFFKHYSRDNPKYHSWLSFDLDTKELIYDTGSRDEDWSNGLIDNIFDKYEYQKIKQFDDEKKSKEFVQLYNLIKTYYETQGYFGNIFTKGLEGLTSYEWQRVSTNKYAVKIIDAFKSDPLFKIGDLVALRATRECTHTSTSSSSILSAYRIPSEISKVLILSNTEPIVNARKGAKRYKVAPIGGKNAQPFWIEEAFMKKLRKKVNKKK